jgi:radical SAM protein with 4Fe4S-binding SPASM domain
MTSPLLMLRERDYLGRHSRTVTRHLTPRKLANAALNGLEMRLKRTVLRSRPVFIKVEPTALCQLKCAGCPRHADQAAARYGAKARLDRETFARIVEPVADTLLGVSLSLRGDPLMNSETLDIVDYCTRHNVGTVFPTNFSYQIGDDQIERIVDCGLDHLIVSIDGTTQEVYEQYRAGGRLDWVLDNCGRVLRARSKRRADRPIVEFKFVVFRHNEHQLADARQLSASMGFDRFTTVLNHAAEERWEEGKKLAAENRRHKRSCYWLYRSTVVCWDGQVIPCCNNNFWKFDMGNAATDGLLSIWNNAEYQAMRRMFRTGVPTGANCANCAGCVHAPLCFGADTPDLTRHADNPQMHFGQRAVGKVRTIHRP